MPYFKNFVGVLWFSLIIGNVNFTPGGLLRFVEATSSPSPKFICYFTSWSTNRTGPARFKISDIPSSACTHIVYSFAVLNSTSLTMDLSAEVDRALIDQVTTLRSNGTKVSVALGGWADSENGTKYSTMINHGHLRTNFVHESVKFLRRHGFDGIDLDFEYPTCWWGNCSTGPVTDKNNFANLIHELRAAYRFYGLLVSVAVAGDVEIVKLAYDMPRIARNVDWIGVMTYDLHSTLSGKTGHHSPYMGPHPNTVDSLDYWINQGDVPPSKLVMGIPLYGRSFTLKDTTVHGVGAPAGQGKAGSFTEEAGFLAYFEFCGAGWSHVEISGVGSYALRGDQWVSYNDVSLLEQKMKHVLQYRLGGVMVWALDLDDFNAQFCNQGRYPLITAMKNALSSSKNSTV